MSRGVDCADHRCEAWRRAALLVSALALLCLGTAGCDGGDGAASSTPTAAPPPTSTATVPPPTATPTVAPPTPTPTLPPPTATPTVASGPLVQWQASADVDGEALLLTPVTALRGSSEYAVVVTTRVRGVAGGALRADEAFRTLAGVPADDGGGPVALFGDDPLAAGNPYPDPRLVRTDGTIDVPDRHALRGVPDTPGTAAAREILRQTAAEVGRIPGFSTTAPIRIELSAAVDLETVTPDSISFFELRDEPGATWSERVLAAARARGLEPAEIALAISFPTQHIADDLRSVRQLLLDRAAAGAGRLTFEDPDPGHAPLIGVFHRDDFEFNEFVVMAPRLANSPDVVAVASALLPSPDFRGDGGVFDAAKVDGSAPASDNEIQVLMTIPAGSGLPPPVVIAQHGFGGSNAFALDVGARLAPYGLAAVGISAVSHGRRGSPIDLLRAGAVQVRDIFRQTVTDQMALVRALEAGVDLDGDQQEDLDSNALAYVGVSLGGLLGAPFAAVEDGVHTAVLNVAGGRVAFLGDNPATRAIYTGDLANRAGLPLDSAEFAVFLRRMLELGQQAFDSVDGLNFARYWSAEPFSGVSRHVLLQEGIGDLWVSNESTEALALAGGLTAGVPMSDPGGVSGLWRFEPPGGHDIFARDDVFAQAAQFLASDGTEIIEPSAP